MKHLGERLTAFVDGELSHGDRDRVLAHLAMCANCRAEADSLRGLKRRLNGLADGVPASELLRRLRALGEPGDPMPPRARPLPGTVRASSAAAIQPLTPSPARSATRPMSRLTGPLGRRPADTRPADNRPGARAEGLPPRRRRRRYVVAGAVSLAVLGIGTASFAAGADSAPLPRVTPAIERFAVEHALISGDVPLTDPVPSPAAGHRP